jgi:hypothetical protein
MIQPIRPTWIGFINSFKLVQFYSFTSLKVNKVGYALEVLVLERQFQVVDCF